MQCDGCCVLGSEAKRGPWGGWGHLGKGKDGLQCHLVKLALEAQWGRKCVA